MSEGAYAGEIAPKEAWAVLARDPKAVLVDVRTQAEWAFVGFPDLSSFAKQPLFVAWQNFPDMQVNAGFAAELEKSGIDRDTPLLFLCRSGQRSQAAAIAMTALGYTRCYNVSTGFEGDADAAGHRGTVGGWKVDALPWVQR